jgi:hypothetical protein
MRYTIPAFLFLAAWLAADQAAAQSCSSFVVIKSYDAAGGTVEVDHDKGNMRKFFPKPEGAPSDTTKIPGSCKSKVTKESKLAVKPAGGRMSTTQVRTNYLGDMTNPPEDSDPATDDEKIQKEWFEAKMKELIAGKTQVVAVIRPGMGAAKDTLNITTIYLPAGEADLAEIKRLEAQAEDL